MSEEDLSRLTGIDPLWVHITPCIAMSTFEQSLAKQRADGVPLDQVRAQLQETIKHHPDADEFVTKFYALEAAAIPDEIRQRHVACVSRIVGIPTDRADVCYTRHYAPFLQALFGAHPQSADMQGTRLAYTACLNTAKGG